ncbi:hypothetical protein FCH28_06020 [Streptomyces piniterrae]|uniref:Secreted protein n=1 Tax=Streptomyces piniterrae TaxID=2571125 RepID=A0A4U0NR23_9ACTN|nr:hypothetical protein [Streptomyces piniterrae]TJZ57029.1 hypothetical protein FCH28_06020 [Streptomyces piniterrae]
MRRIVMTLGVVAAAVTLVVSGPGSAYAAEGSLVVGGVEYVDPSGCYDTDSWPLTVDNYTDRPALVFAEPNCGGTPIEFVAPGASTVSEFGSSVYVP